MRRVIVCRQSQHHANRLLEGGAVLRCRRRSAPDLALEELEDANVGEDDERSREPKQQLQYEAKRRHSLKTTVVEHKGITVALLFSGAQHSERPSVTSTSRVED